MARKLVLITLVSLLIAALLAPAAFAALTDQQQKNIQDIYQKMEALKKQLADEYLKAGVITEEEAAWMKERAELKTQFRLERDAQGLYGPRCYGGGGMRNGGGFRGGAQGAGFGMRAQ